MGFFFEEIFHFAKTTEFSLKGAWGTGMFDLNLLPDPTHPTSGISVETE